LQRRYAEKVDFGEYEPKIRKLLDEYIEAKDVEIVVPEFSLFERDLFSEEIDKIADPVSKAYAIANRIKKTITEKMDEDEYLFQQFSEMVRTVIKDYEEKRLSDAQFLKKMQGLVEQVRSRNGDEKLPDLLQGKGVARAYWGRVKLDTEEKVSDDIAAELAVAADDIIERHRIVNWVRNQNVVNQMVLDVGDSLYDTCKAKGVVVSLDLAEKIARGIVDIAKEQRA
jgi:type I restriction enzyme R subunit